MDGSIYSTPADIFNPKIVTLAVIAITAAKDLSQGPGLPTKRVTMDKEPTQRGSARREERLLLLLLCTCRSLRLPSPGKPEGCVEGVSSQEREREREGRQGGVKEEGEPKL
ncbi:hypothetical protein EYF80_032840 [Liparis tanakae]|uniref:Uncharacterized protein n=1 Tax=Liparis tanakae TaxID=230148 RepID=A0A4Z2GW11_9TELE|nr:hypothetical protein EYF80_032840 [Liparis tanakae]